MNPTLLLGIIALAASGCGSAQHRRALLGDEDGATETSQPPLTAADLVIVIPTTKERLPLVHASRPARRGIRTIIAVETAADAAALNEQTGGLVGPHAEAYVAWADAQPDEAAGGGPYGRYPPAPTLHAEHRAGPRAAMAPLLAHELLTALARKAAAATAANASAAAPPPYRWVLLGRDDTLWLPRHALALLSGLSGRAAAVCDHLADWNGLTLLSPSRVAAACLPCGFNLTAVLGRKRPPKFPQPVCPVCRPSSGCEFRFDVCGGLVGDASGCGTRRFLGSGDRCGHSWPAAGAGTALNFKLLSYIGKEKWVSCVRDGQPTTGERALGRCLWRTGFGLTLTGAGLAARLSRDPFSPHHMLFGNPMARQAVFGAEADTLLGPVYTRLEVAAAAARATAEGKARAAAAAAAAAGDAAGAVKAIAAGGVTTPGGQPWLYGATDLTIATPSTRLAVAAPPPPPPPPPPLVIDGVVVDTGAGVTLAPPLKPCDMPCTAKWVAGAAVSAHLDVPMDEFAALTGSELAAAAALMAAAAERMGKEAGLPASAGAAA
ncbi:hypothetical protein HXX76_009686 [Chlamydomonas incerta]|uniref:Uncharacterized protein n=1 Tax=Chlamydomonas incerta TaxID=51695 RepID=A0A835VZY9_CHLIN|nr:hypothetical protein HXX76_009686 [Chlamydomonas incerta]|eukprot:KAG2431156.1 hypothetical protein HXX76_009686 [Chlamydomonas incerta]